jgi:hypothetical protein
MDGCDSVVGAQHFLLGSDSRILAARVESSRAGAQWQSMRIPSVGQRSGSAAS